MLLLMEERSCPVRDSGGVSKHCPELVAGAMQCLELQRRALKINPCSARLRGHLW